MKDENYIRDLEDCILKTPSTPSHFIRSERDKRLDQVKAEIYNRRTNNENPN